MPARTLPTSYKVVRPITLSGTLYQPGATVTAAVIVAGLGKKYDAWVSRGFLRPIQNQYPKTAQRSTPTRDFPPVHLNQQEIRNSQ